MYRIPVCHIRILCRGTPNTPACLWRVVVLPWMYRIPIYHIRILCRGTPNTPACLWRVVVLPWMYRIPIYHIRIFNGGPPSITLSVCRVVAILFICRKYFERATLLGGSLRYILCLPSGGDALDMEYSCTCIWDPVLGVPSTVQSGEYP